MRHGSSVTCSDGDAVSADQIGGGADREALVDERTLDRARTAVAARWRWARRPRVVAPVAAVMVSDCTGSSPTAATHASAVRQSSANGATVVLAYVTLPTGRVSITRSSAPLLLGGVYAAPATDIRWSATRWTAAWTLLTKHTLPSAPMTAAATFGSNVRVEKLTFEASAGVVTSDDTSWP